MSVYASSDIRRGDEITIEYVPLVLRPRSARRDLLARAFGFRCRCGVCGADDDAVRASDARRAEVARLVDDVARRGAEATSDGRRAVVRSLERVRELLDAEGYRALPDFGPEHEAVSKSYVLYIANRGRFQELEAGEARVAAVSQP